MLRGSVLICLCLSAVVAVCRPLCAADDAAIQAAIRKGQAHLLSTIANLREGPKSFAAYALVKTGIDKSDQRIQDAVAHAVSEAREHYAPGMPRYGAEYARAFAYMVPCHMFLLEAVDPEAYQAELAGMAEYLSQHQQSNGSWFYTEVPTNEASDTSQTQFALLGLWAAHRAGVDVSAATLQKAGQWLIKTQREDGGFAYQPWDGATLERREVSLSITLSGAGSLLVVRQISHTNAKSSDGTPQPVQPRKRFGVLDRLQDVQERERPQGPKEINISAASYDKAVARSQKYIQNKFQSPSHYATYMFYAMERLSALLDSEELGGQNWYAYASDQLLKTQLADGHWTDSSGSPAATGFAILCLTRATAKILDRPVGRKIGGGLLAGARGLPSDLSQMKLKDGAGGARKSKGNVDDLLAELEKTKDVSVAELQKTILESIDLDRPEQLVGQTDRLRRLAADPRSEVRATAYWAIGRSGEIRLAPYLIRGLKDVDIDVIREASLGLTVLSRKPTGINQNGRKVPVDPLDDLDEGASEEQRQTHLDQWIAQAETAWKAWYLSVRPYEERDDRQELQRKRPSASK